MRAKLLLFFAASTILFLLTVGCGGVPQAPIAPSQFQPAPVRHSASAQLSVDPASIAFSSVNVGSSATLSLVLANTGNADANIDSLSVSDAAFRVSGPATTFKLAAGYSVTLQVSFAPASAASFQGTLTITSAGNPTLSVPLSGTGTELSSAGTVQHKVLLAWQASTSVVDGYYVYRSSQSGGPYTRVNSTAVAVTSYNDSTVSGGHTYFYVVTAVAGGIESVYSMEIAASVPSP